MVDTTHRGAPVGERGHSASVANENISSLHPKRVSGEVSSSSEVVEHLLESTVSPGDATVAGDHPRDVGREELLEGGAGAARVELVLHLPSTPPPRTAASPPLKGRHRRINHALHLAAVTLLRNPTSASHTYYERKLAGGKTRKEALRCVKRRLSDVVFANVVGVMSYGSRAGLLFFRVL